MKAQFILAALLALISSTAAAPVVRVNFNVVHRNGTLNGDHYDLTTVDNSTAKIDNGTLSLANKDAGKIDNDTVSYVDHTPEATDLDYDGDNDSDDDSDYDPNWDADLEQYLDEGWESDDDRNSSLLETTGARDSTTIYKRGLFGSKKGNVDKGYFVVPLSKSFNTYRAKLEFGSHGRDAYLTVNTESGDIIVAGNKHLIPGWQEFDTRYSSSFHEINADFKTTVSGRAFAGRWGKDKVKIDGTQEKVSLKDVTFAVAEYNNDYGNVLGLGPQQLEASTLYSHQTFSYDNIFTQLKNQGVISKKSVSLSLNGNGDEGHELIFGGIDQGRLNGNLTYFPYTLKPTTGNHTASSSDHGIYIPIKSASHDGKQLTSHDYSAKIASGKLTIGLPSEMFKQIVNKYGKYNIHNNITYISCAANGPDFTFTFNGNKTITVPFENLVLKFIAHQGILGINTCQFAIEESKTNNFELGTPFLQSAYVNFDYENEKIGLTQAKFSSPSKIVQY